MDIPIKLFDSSDVHTLEEVIGDFSEFNGCVKKKYSTKVANDCDLDAIDHFIIGIQIRCFNTK